MFRAFDLGLSFAAIVQNFNLEPEKVRAYYTEYAAGLHSAPPIPFTPEQILKREAIAAKARTEQSRIELARERLADAQARRRERAS